ncbi:MAG: triose-phosphate isomerase [Candidatus Latescibacteria bacterium]|nr:triose-phosphate isomerase [Candidatus Latescibacterota bacterium]
MRKKIVAGNWKMNKNHEEAAELARGVVRLSGGEEGVDVVLCPPFTALQAVAAAVGGTSVMIGGQNMHWEEKGAYTGEISANMLLTLGCGYVILGHSERRGYFGETDEIVARKLNTALNAGLTPIVCVGETKDEREGGITEQVIDAQVRGALEGLTPERFDGSIIAYEPVWAIGTGLTASVKQAQDVHRFIRGILGDLFGKEIAEKTRIQYGGSVKPSNAGELFGEPDIDGGLIGGAALDPESFGGIVKAAKP